MPLTFIDIERQKSWRIAVFFAVLLLVYICVLAVLGAAFSPFLVATSLRFWTAVLPIAALIAAAHFWLSASDAVRDVVRSLDARPPDPDDSVHRVLSNVMEELHIVTGNRRRISCAVIPSLSLNALAAADLKGNALIAITEGLLSRLTRPQIEAVVAHEAHHILSGDCLETTVAASIFGSLSAAMEKSRYSSEGRGFTVPAFFLAWLLLQFSNLLNMFISREREYRADAAAVRMNRNPVALAEVLFLLSRSWRGTGFIGSGFEMLCIVNPQATVLDESEGFLADLFSTHPPIRKRMRILLAMARVPISELEARATKAANTGEGALKTYYALSPEQRWEGPFTLSDLAALTWLGPLTWITEAAHDAAARAWKDPQINALFLARVQRPDVQPEGSSGFLCPTCHQPLAPFDYEGTRNCRCSYCAGVLVKTVHIPRIIARTAREDPCSDRINALARAALSQNSIQRLRQVHSGPAQSSAPKLSCPECKNPMYRGFYSLTYLIELDRCSFCGLTWFDRDELEMLQCMVENRLAAAADVVWPDSRPSPAGTPEPSA
jgi:heat shock protein HtpX